MTHEQLAEAHRTLASTREALAGIMKNGGAEGALAEAVDAIADVVDSLVSEKLDASLHAHAVAEEIKRGPGVESSGTNVSEIAQNPDARD